MPGVASYFHSEGDINGDDGIAKMRASLLSRANAVKMLSDRKSPEGHRQWAGGATERGTRKPHELAAGTAALRSAGLRPASSGGFQPPVLVVPSRCAPRSGQDAFKNGAGTAASARFVFAARSLHLFQSRKFWKLTARGKSWARIAVMTVCN